MRLPPPILQGTIPAFCGSTLKISFGMNKSVSVNQINGFSLKLKTVQSNISVLSNGSKEIYINSNNNSINSNDDNPIWNRQTNIVTFTGIKGLRIGQFYKVQLAYIGIDNTIGYYSTVGVVKYTSDPVLSIVIASDGEHYTGTYSQYSKNTDKDYNEKVYSYCFTLKDSDNNIIETSGELLHNSYNDNVLYESNDQYRIQTSLDRNKSYTLTYSITTINGLKKSISLNNIINISSINPRLNTKIQCDLDYENGCINVKLVKPDGIKVEEPAVGHFYLLRASDEDAFKTWKEIFYFELQGEQPARHLWNDMTIKQGIRYKYAIQQFNNNNIYSNKIESNIVYADFEHAFLYDGEKQLKINFNPKISSFKNTLLESKVDTIGNKHPFIFRNGNVNYKEFPISGLISYLSDENKMFNDCYFSGINQRLTARERVSTNFDIQNRTSLNSNNIYLERTFKLDVLEWLTNGKPKLFRSPTEGNYIVRLMNVSLTPTDSLGRMLHTFTCTAYEVAENNYSNLEKFNLISTNAMTSKAALQWKSVDLSLNKISSGVNLLQHTASSIYLEDLTLGDKLRIITHQGNQNNEFTIAIGATGRYILDLDDDIEISHVSFVSFGDVNAIYRQGLLTYSYYSTDFIGSFEMITNVTNHIIPCEQFIGQYDNIIEEIETVKDKIDHINFIKFTLRNDDIVIYTSQNYAANNTYYSDKAMTDPVDPVDLTNIYKVNVLDQNGKVINYYWLDGYNNIDLGKECKNEDTLIVINGKTTESIDIKDTFLYELKSVDNITSISIGAAVIAEISYTKKSITYSIENESKDIDLKTARDNYDKAQEVLNTAVSTATTTSKVLKAAQDDYKQKYRAYCVELNRLILEAERS